MSKENVNGKTLNMDDLENVSGGSGVPKSARIVPNNNCSFFGGFIAKGSDETQICRNCVYCKSSGGDIWYCSQKAGEVD